MIVASRVRWNSDQERRIIAVMFLTAKTTPSGRSRYTRVFTPAFTGESAIGTICDRLGPELNVTRRAFLISVVSDQATNTMRGSFFREDQDLS